MTGSVATLTPMPSITISASHRNDVMTSGTSATTTARQLRKVMKHSNVTAPYSTISIVALACRTTMFVTASMPADPAAGRNCSSLVSCFAAKSSAMPSTRLKVSALWSLRYAITGVIAQPGLLSSGLFIIAGRTAMLTSVWLRGSVIHFGEPSKPPAV